MEKEYSSKKLAEFCAELANEKLSKDILVMNLKKIDTAPTDYFVLCTCDSEPQLFSTLKHFERKSKEAGLGRVKVEGGANSDWILIDYFDVVVHLMLPEPREFYKLEKLWSDAEFYSFDEDEKLALIEYSKELQI